jgi:hypothetical protein
MSGVRVESRRVVCSIITKAWSNLIHDNIFKSFLNQHIALEIELNVMVIGICGLTKRCRFPQSDDKQTVEDCK